MRAGAVEPSILWRDLHLPNTFSPATASGRGHDGGEIGAGFGGCGLGAAAGCSTFRPDRIGLGDFGASLLTAGADIVDTRAAAQVL